MRTSSTITTEECSLMNDVEQHRFLELLRSEGDWYLDKMYKENASYSTLGDDVRNYIFSLIKAEQKPVSSPSAIGVLHRLCKLKFRAAMQVLGVWLRSLYWLQLYAHYLGRASLPEEDLAHVQAKRLLEGLLIIIEISAYGFSISTQVEASRMNAKRCLHGDGLRMEDTQMRRMRSDVTSMQGT